MKTCVASGAEIHMGFPSVTEKLDSREIEYLAGRELPEVPGLQLRQDSADGNTITAWATATVTVTLTTNGPLPVTMVTPFTLPSPGPGGQAGDPQGQGPVTTFFESNHTQAAPTRPWMVTANEMGRNRPSYLGLFLWAAGLLVLDYTQGY
jgi:hypothetical protein